MIHHQVETTHDDGENVKTQKQITKYGSVSGGAAQVRYYGAKINGLPDKYYYSSDHPDFPTSNSDSQKEDISEEVQPSGPVSPSSYNKPEQTSSANNPVSSTTTDKSESTTTENYPEPEPQTIPRPTPS